MRFKGSEDCRNLRKKHHSLLMAVALSTASWAEFLSHGEGRPKENTSAKSWYPSCLPV